MCSLSWWYDKWYPVECQIKPNGYMSVWSDMFSKEANKWDKDSTQGQVRRQLLEECIKYLEDLLDGE